ncbi:DUF305 domain-containing protein [Tsukamurella ocularis]|uniref:DUF305 domain-containing protein n=1 Tax=Tsukamurella ocularis TaxID=1970234 RepID=UPI002167AE63|nr:DUF305 domain-containing protein [Tsukamurella ocularis]MCS3781244.1 uncharacterized protein (DUF305 family) [Tsukamurella ocularis]MCS3787615.1 uncharacterized protein (DUF305 family) [Tsukamurella ocularis]MCS3850910.1 uncharacterized protein (DUF305 family) [Tsukamurella ocularis]
MTDFTERRSVRAAAAVLAIALAVVIGVLVGKGSQSVQPAQEPGGPQRLSAADIGFAQDMLAHHQQALQMVELLGPDLSADVRGIATQIQLSQSREIGVLMGWLEVVGQPLQNPHPMAWMTDESAAPSTSSASGGHAGHAMPATTSSSVSAAPTVQHAMPGMATSEELTALTNTPGVQQEILFLQLMLRHHQGGVDMAAYGQRRGDAPAVRQRATAMVKEQSDEISMMLIQLTVRNATSLPYP